MLAHAALALSLVVRVYDAYGVPANRAAAALVTASGLLETAGIGVTWAVCPCDGRAADSDLLVRITSAPDSADPKSLGFSYIDVEQGSGTLATVFADRIRALARSAPVDEDAVLGRAIAHEIAHLLLGTRTHETIGLMRGRWTSTELATNRPADWQFSREDGAKLRQAVVRRLRAQAEAVAIARGQPEEAPLSAP